MGVSGYDYTSTSVNGNPYEGVVRVSKTRHVRALRVAGAIATICMSLAGCGSGGQPARPSTGQGGSPAGQVAGTTKEVSFETNGTTTYGTLEVPAHSSDRRLAAVLLLAGSGPTDRDGNQPPDVTPNTLHQMADALDRMGIMSLRFDKYFTGRTGAGRYASDPGSMDLNAYIRQADDAYRLLSSQPAADRQRLLVVGHSEGGFFAILVADTVTPKPAGLALVEPQDERILDLVAVQINESLDAQVTRGVITADTARQNAQGVRDAIAAFRAGQQVNTAGLLPGVVSTLAPLVLTPVNARTARTDDAIYPPTYAAKVPAGTRVLVTDGTADTNIPPFTIQPLIDALRRAGTTGPGLRTLTGINHNLNPAGTPANGAPLDPSFLTALQDWAQPYTPAS